MVDFNNENTITVAPDNINKILKLQKREFLLESIEFYDKNRFQHQETISDLAFIRSRAINLFREILGELTRHSKANKDFNLDELRTKLQQGTEDELLEAIETLFLFLDDLGLTRIDNKVKYDSTRVEIENRVKKI